MQPDTTNGGLLVGATDKDGGKGIKVLAPEGEILMGGGEIIINEEAAKKHCSELSKINESTGGVKIPCDLQKHANQGPMDNGGKLNTMEENTNKEIDLKSGAHSHEHKNILSTATLSWARATDGRHFYKVFEGEKSHEDIYNFYKEKGIPVSHTDITVINNTIRQRDLSALKQFVEKLAKEQFGEEINPDTLLIQYADHGDHGFTVNDFEFELKDGSKVKYDSKEHKLIKTAKSGGKINVNPDSIEIGDIVTWRPDPLEDFQFTGTVDEISTVNTKGFEKSPLFGKKLFGVKFDDKHTWISAGTILKHEKPFKAFTTHARFGNVELESVGKRHYLRIGSEAWLLNDAQLEKLNFHMDSEKMNPLTAAEYLAKVDKSEYEKVTKKEEGGVAASMANGGKTSVKYKGFTIYQHDGHAEIKGYSSHSGTFFQSGDITNISEAKTVIDLALDKNYENNIKSDWPDQWSKSDIHKRIVYFSQFEHNDALPKYENGGKLDKKFNVGDVVWDKGNKCYGTILDNYGIPTRGDYGDVRLDSDGNQPISNLVHIGEEGDAGNGDLTKLKASAKRIIKSATSKAQKERYEIAYKRLLAGEFDKSMNKGGKTRKEFLVELGLDDIKQFSTKYKDWLQDLKNDRENVEGEYVGYQINDDSITIIFKHATAEFEFKKGKFIPIKDKLVHYSSGGNIPEGTTVQTLIFDNKKFKKSQAIKWAKEHNFQSKYFGVDQTENTHRIRQIKPSKFKPSSFRTIELTDGVQAVIGHLRANNK